jgi:CRISPR-associated protein Cas1
MIKKTLYFGNPAYLSKKEEQLRIQFPNETDTLELKNLSNISIEDIGFLIIDN